jgi:monoamine oxidase
MLAEVAQYTATLDEDLPLGTAIATVLDEWDLSEEEYAALLTMVSTNIELEYAADVDDLSAWWWNNDSGFRGGNALFPDGYDQVIEGLAAGLDIRLNEVVETVEYGTAGVTVTTASGSFEADYAIVTLPLGVLKSGAVHFDPLLPAAKQAAIRNLGMSVINKMYLHFPEVFWDTDAEWISYLGDGSGAWAATLNIYAYTEEPVLLLFNSAEYGLAMEDMSDAALVEAGMEMLYTLYGADIPDPDGVLITRWGKDPFALGSYSSIYFGATPTDRSALAEPVQNVLFFAGEATSLDYPGTVQGALLSGRRAAAEIMQL